MPHLNGTWEMISWLQTLMPRKRPKLKQWGWRVTLHNIPPPVRIVATDLCQSQSRIQHLIITKIDCLQPEVFQVLTLWSHADFLQLSFFIPVRLFWYYIWLFLDKAGEEKKEKNEDEKEGDSCLGSPLAVYSYGRWQHLRHDVLMFLLHLLPITWIINERLGDERDKRQEV